jgi:hypothetical protein
MNLYEIYSKIVNPTNYVIDIGASSGVNSDPVYPFISNNKYKGLCIEGNAQNIPRLRQNISSTFDIYNGYITPHNVLSIFEQYKVPRFFDVLKIDIDGYDLDVLRTILEKYQPRIIIAEYNEKIPPPIHFEIKYKDNYQWDYSHCFGFSISAGKKVMDKYHYKILSICELNNILCINFELCNLLSVDFESNVYDIYQSGYIAQHDERIKHLPWNENVNYWLNIKDPALLKSEILTYFTKINDRSQFQVKTKIEGVDFYIE